MNDENNGYDVEEPKKQGLSGFVIAMVVAGGCLVALAVLGVLAGLLVPTITKGKERAQRIHCLNNMKTLSKLSMLHADDHDGAFPATLEELVDASDVDPDILICPSDDEGVTCSYEIVPGVKVTDSSETLLIREIDSKHPGGRNGVFVDGRGQWISD